MCEKSIVIIIFYLIHVQTRYIPDDFDSIAEKNKTKSIAEEIQHATCSISSADLEATANATVTRQLKGVCTTDHFDERLDILEKLIITEFNVIKSMLAYTKAVPNTVTLNHGKATHIHGFDSDFHTPKKHINEGNTSNKPHGIYFKNYKNQIVKKDIPNAMDRENEMVKNNMTIHKDSTGIIFLYFWKIENIFDIKSSQDVESGDFHFSGYHLFLKMQSIIHQTNQLSILVVGIGEFKLPHQFSILSHTSAELDYTSPIIRNCTEKLNKIHVQCDAFRITKETLLLKNLIKNDMIIVKLMIYL